MTKNAMFLTAGLVGVAGWFWARNRKRAALVAESVSKALTEPAVDVGPPIVDEATVSGDYPAPVRASSDNIRFTKADAVSHILLAKQAKLYDAKRFGSSKPVRIENFRVGDFVTSSGRSVGCSVLATKYADLVKSGVPTHFSAAQTQLAKSVYHLVYNADCKTADEYARKLRSSLMGDAVRAAARRSGATSATTDRYASFATRPATTSGSTLQLMGFSGVFGSPVFSAPAIPRQKELPVGFVHAGDMGPRFESQPAPPSFPRASVY